MPLVTVAPFKSNKSSMTEFKLRGVGGEREPYARFLRILCIICGSVRRRERRGASEGGTFLKYYFRGIGMLHVVSNVWKIPHSVRGLLIQTRKL